jgi:hypothetical protein
MPWELTVLSETADPASDSRHWPPLGTGEAVCRRISACLPDVQWRREPSFIEKHQHLAADHPIRKFIADMTAEQRAWSSRPEWRGQYGGAGFTLEFFFADATISFFHIDVRGGGNPMPTLAALCRANGWLLKEAATGKLLELTATSAPEWEAFTQWRHQAIGEIARRRELERNDD